MTPKFEFPRLTKAKLSSVNVRSEKHGKELVPAVDLKIVIDQGNDILDKFHPELKAALYFKAKDEDKQDELDGIEAITNMPNLKFPKLDMPLKWGYEGSGYRLDVDYGLGESSNLEMFGCEVNNIAFACKEGGTVEVSYRVQVSNIEERIIGKLAGLVQHEISIILTPPTVEEVAPIVAAMETPFLNPDPAPLDRDPDDIGAGPLFPETPEQALETAAG